MDAQSGAYQVLDSEEVLTLVGVVRLLPILLVSDSHSPGPDTSRGGSPKVTPVLAFLTAATDGRCQDGSGRTNPCERLRLASLIKHQFQVRVNIEGERSGISCNRLVGP